MIDERTEQLTNRKLDGELTEVESLELNRMLIRSPEARTLLDEYERTDDLAASAMAAVLAGRPEHAHHPAEIRTWTTTGQRWRWRSRRGLGVAVAALIAVMIGGLPNGRLGSDVSPRYPSDSIAPIEAGVMPFDWAGSVPVMEGPRQEKEQIQRNVIAVYDPRTQRVYLLEIDQIRSMSVPFQENY